MTDLINKQIKAKLAEIDDLTSKLVYFERHFEQYFADADDLAARVDAA